MGRNKSTTPDPDRWQEKLEGQADRDNKKSAKGRDIGEVPPIKNVRRRSKCRTSLRLFCETYNPAAFKIKWSRDHLRSIARIEEAVTCGALYAFAEPRGNGKTTRVRMAALWAIAYGLCRYVFIIGATGPKGEDALYSVKTCARFLPLFGEDFPEISHPVRALKGIAQKAAGQTCLELPTLIEWSTDRIVLPTVPPPSNWPKSWPLRPDGMVPTSGGVVSASGLTAEGIRGSLLTLSTGEMVRPDLVLLDDPQTSESARSLTQNESRLRLISSDVLGMAGPGKAISAVMPCTVIERGDMIDQVLDRAKHPMWRGERTRMLTSMPVNLAAWDSHFEIYQECAQAEPPDFTRANEDYLARRTILDEGAEASWPERHLPLEVSAIQSAMYLYFRDPQGFAAEYQNEPWDTRATGSFVELTAEEVSAKLNRVPRGLVPFGVSRLTGFVDVQGQVLFWMVVGWDDRFGGGVIDYGAWPRQPRAYFQASEVNPSLESQFPGKGLEARIFAGLEVLSAELLSRRWQRQDGSEPGVIERLGIDSGWQTDTVHEAIRRSPHAALLWAGKGRAFTASAKPISTWKVNPGERAGMGWHAGKGRHVTVDTNVWKSFAHERLRTSAAAPGCLWICGEKPFEHQLLADHITSEYRVLTHGQGRDVEEWKVHANKAENHWLDCLVGCAVGASLQGLVWSAGSRPETRPAIARPARFSDQQRAKREGRG